MNDQQKVREAFPRYAAYRHLRAYGAWPSGVPDWAKNHEGSMDDVTLRNAVIDELAQAALAHASSATVKENLTAGEGEEVAWRWRDDVRPGLPWRTTPDREVMEKLRAAGCYEIEPLYTHSAPSSEDARAAPDIKTMVSRFLSWRLPQDFRPDGGISFTHITDPAWTHDNWPIGTNLFHAGQVEVMLRHILTAATQPPEGARVVPGVRERNGDAYLVDSARNDPDHAASPLFEDPRAFEVTFTSNGRVQYLPPDCADIAESCRKQGNTVVPLFALAAPTLAGKEGAK